MPDILILPLPMSLLAMASLDSCESILVFAHFGLPHVFLALACVLVSKCSPHPGQVAVILWCLAVLHSCEQYLPLPSRRSLGRTFICLLQVLQLVFISYL